MHYLGIDVAKAKLDCCLLVDIAKNKIKSKSVENSPQGIADLLIWMTKQNIIHADLQAVMEATGIYHELAAIKLHEAGVTVSVANPAQVKYFARGLAVRTKTDAVDSRVLARYGALVQPLRWTPPPPEARVLKDLLVRREAITQDLQREKNRQEATEIAQNSVLIQQSLGDSIHFLTRQLKKIQSHIDDHIDRHPSFKRDLELMESLVLDLDVGRITHTLDLPGMPHLGSGITWPWHGTTILATPNLKEGSVTFIDINTWKTIKKIDIIKPIDIRLS